MKKVLSLALFVVFGILAMYGAVKVFDLIIKMNRNVLELIMVILFIGTVATLYKVVSNND